MQVLPYLPYLDSKDVLQGRLRRRSHPPMRPYSRHLSHRVPLTVRPILKAVVL